MDGEFTKLRGVIFKRDCPHDDIQIGQHFTRFGTCHAYLNI
jgi:hypothetical protein